ncbi:MAG: D-Ala-D-Ala carboxypeptidase family metallohydrolase [Halioglobus sp.]|nr:D-Ala-D-Ala carboxypeptidase family metallohydrolase [Halioglobus sp.]
MHVISKYLLALFFFLSVEAMSQPLSIGVRGHVVQLEIFSLFAHPGEKLRLGLSSYDVGELQLWLDDAIFGEPGDGSWSIMAPLTPGLYTLQLRRNSSNQLTRINLFVGHSIGASQEEINGYQLGPPPPGSPLRPAFYIQPKIYFEVSEENADTQISPHFTLRQFLCKQESDATKYLTIREPLLFLLEELVTAVQEAGYPVETFGIISGYRTSRYNEKIGNVPNSRHVYGDALDFYVDLDGDGAMDDLNGDGKNNAADVDLLFEIVESVRRQEQSLPMGGMGRYYQAPHHGGFVHVDTRGYTARW